VLAQQAGKVTFSYKDYAQGARQKCMSLQLGEFIRRLRLHLLPAGFVKIRHYGLLADRGRQPRLQQTRARLGWPKGLPCFSPALAAPVPALREGGVVPGAGGAAAAVQSRTGDNRHLMSRSPHPPPQIRARKPNRRSVGRPILFANGKKRAQLVFHAQDDAHGSARRTRGPEIRPPGAGVWAHRQPARAASSHARGDSARYFPL